jgi:hypothetical protein
MTECSALFLTKGFVVVYFITLLAKYDNREGVVTWIWSCVMTTCVVVALRC